MELTNQQIDQRLLDLGAKLSQLESDLGLASKAYLIALAEYDNEVDKHYLSARASDEFSSIKDAETNASLKSYQSRLKMIEKKSAYEAIKNQVDITDKKIGILQSLIKLRTAELRNL